MGETDDSSSFEVPKTQNSEPKTQNFLYPFTPHTPLPHPSLFSRSSRMSRTGRGRRHAALPGRNP